MRVNIYESFLVYLHVFGPIKYTAMGRNGPQWKRPSRQGRIQDFLKGVTWVRRMRTCEHPLCAQLLKGANPVELEVSSKVALRRRNLRAHQSPFLALKHFARVVDEVP